MIPAGRTAVDEAGAAAACGVSLDTLRRHRDSRGGFPAALNRHAQRRRLYDREQVRAWWAGEPTPPLPDQEHPDDLFDAAEVSALLGIKPMTWISAVRRGHRPHPDRGVCGVEHWRRATVQAELERPARNPGGVGRPRGAADRGPRRPYRPRQARPNPRLDRVKQMLAEAAGDPVPAPAVAAELGVSERTAQRLLAAARGEA